MRVRQYAICAVAAVLIWVTMGRTRPHVVSNAPGLAGTFNALGGIQAAAAAAAPKLGLQVMHEPTITAAQIDAVLAQYHSPAVGQGQVIYDLGKANGIDPAICLAFFIHESSAGSNPAWAGWKSDGGTTHNIGNIVCTAGYQCYGRFRDYISWQMGIADWYTLIKDLYVGEWKRTTVEEIIPKYAPAADNNDELAYINSVKQMVQSWQKGQ
ncbi:MAG: glucosaminidase domain-containing protein [Herpetosiphonaceae bacterium]|nr:glucosaminidase domain-containing protein [Herpetosiphonaceae bacterium]